MIGYGKCPRCGSQGKLRERRSNGNTTCERGHVYPSRESVDVPPRRFAMTLDKGGYLNNIREKLKGPHGVCREGEDFRFEGNGSVLWLAKNFVLDRKTEAYLRQVARIEPLAETADAINREGSEDRTYSAAYKGQTIKLYAGSYVQARHLAHSHFRPDKGDENEVTVSLIEGGPFERMVEALTEEKVFPSVVRFVKLVFVDDAKQRDVHLVRPFEVDGSVYTDFVRLRGALEIGRRVRPGDELILVGYRSSPGRAVAGRRVKVTETTLFDEEGDAAFDYKYLGKFSGHLSNHGAPIWIP